MLSNFYFDVFEPWSFLSVVFSLQIFGDFLDIFPLLIFTEIFIIVKTRIYKTYFIDQNMVYLSNVSCAFIKYVYTDAVGWNVI